MQVLWLINPNKVEDLAKTISEVATDKIKRTSASKLAVKYVGMRYNWDNIVNELMECIE